MRVALIAAAVLLGALAEPAARASDPLDDPFDEDEVEQPEDTNVTDFAHASEFGAVADRTWSGDVFAVASNAGRCAVDCTVLWHSADGGGTWSLVEAEGMGRPHHLLLPPGYPDDNRLYALGNEGLRLSRDGGRSFRLVNEPINAPVAMAPGFSRGDERILVGSPPGWRYDAQSDLTLPWGDGLLVSTGHFAFAPDHDESGVLFATTLVSGPLQTAKAFVIRCVERDCSHRVPLPGVQGIPQLAVSSSFSEDGRVFAWGPGGFFRSTDGGLSFQSLEPPIPGAAVVSAISDDGRGRVYAAVRFFGTGGGVAVSTSGGDPGTWRLTGEGTELEQGAGDVTVLPGGAVLAVPASSQGNGVWCSVNHGVTWERRCSAGLRKG